ncbi:hypothetical protein GCM10010399_49780 [Dactylosporangium fulvum]
MQIGGRLKVCGDPAGRQHVEEVLPDPGIDVADHCVFLRYQAVVPPAAPRPTPWHSSPLPAVALATPGAPRTYR